MISAVQKPAGIDYWQSHRAALIRGYFEELEHQQIDYGLLHTDEHFPDRLVSDVDYVVRTADIDRARRLREEIACRYGWILVHEIPISTWGYYAVLADPHQPEHYVALDVCSHYTRGGRLFLCDDQLLSNRQKRGGLYYVSPVAEFAYRVCKGIAKCKPWSVMAPQLQQLRPRLAAVQPSRRAESWERAFTNQEIWSIDSEAAWQALAQRVLRRAKYTLRDWWQAAPYYRQRLREPAGIHIRCSVTTSESSRVWQDEYHRLTQHFFFRWQRLPGCNSAPFPAVSNDLPGFAPVWWHKRRATCVVEIVLPAGPVGARSRHRLAAWCRRVALRPELIFAVDDATAAEPLSINCRMAIPHEPVVSHDHVRQQAHAAACQTIAFLRQRRQRSAHRQTTTDTNNG